MIKACSWLFLKGMRFPLAGLLILHISFIICAQTDPDKRRDTSAEIDWSKARLGPSTMRHMWITPIQVFSLLGDAKARIDQRYLHHVLSEMLLYFDRFSAVQNATVTGRSPYTMQDLFYRYQQQLDVQMKQCYRKELNNPSLKEIVRDERHHRLEIMNNCSAAINRPVVLNELASIFATAARQYLNELYVDWPHQQMGSQDHADPLRSVFSWCSILRDGTMHAMHHHVDSAVSGVLYISVPASQQHSAAAADVYGDAHASSEVSENRVGDLVFYDPRGSLPPFGRSLHVHPQPGDLVLFPGWLTHAVEPTAGSTPRVSISFNLDGKWELTTDINQGYVAD